ncbi:MAG: putative transcriptional regulator [Frankiaceae bacterium]|nr:putative transcriptional regulator [Frankiaceae bacterium]
MVDDGFRGRLLVATPALVDPNFARSVILLLEFGDEGAVGVVLNRPSGTPVANVLPDWSLHTAEPGVVFVGGPVSPDGAICLGRSPTGGVGVPPWTFFDGLIGTVDLTAGPDSVDDRTAVRVYAGYAGWGAEQLELEIEIGSWYVVDGSADDVFCREPDELWRAVLKRQPGQLAMVANFPMDPSLN